ncbi:50S ribosomal protein L24 [Alkalicella caledoniensis]|uniref:Large ribosomal subunit protein uL24 n=1 Tax=Alkalicella caledoniensis TaxID=2731377 RepID=A0A7G9W7W8_ALKCA|nr:50S ribosomal protein L24 [Alkalicella caledoniensis]QNO14780.1 50S ribosomal protein L24 [Alkalicella caledoniensis]
MANKVHVKTGDKVTILSGKDKDKQGKVLSVFPKEGKVIVEGVNIVKRHTKPTRENPQGGIIEREGAVESSKVMLVCPRCNKPTRAAKKFLQDGNKVRQCKKCSEVIDK